MSQTNTQNGSGRFGVLPAGETDKDTGEDIASADAIRGPQQSDTGSYDPVEFSVADVRAYLEGADDTERQRVLDAEKAGKGRKGILGDD